MTAPRDRFLLWARLAEHRYRVRRAMETVAVWLSQCQRPYIAFSAGKDSTCVLDLVRRQAPDTPAVYIDAQCAFPEAEELLSRTPNLIRWPADEPFFTTLKRCGLDGEFVERETMRTTVYGPVARLVASYGYDGMAYGLRAEESRARKMNGRRGRIFRYKRDGVLACQPIVDWSYRDVWAYIFSRNLPYCGTYDRLWDAPEDDQRISYWAGETKRRWGRYTWLKRNYPELWNRLAAEVPDVRAYA